MRLKLPKSNIQWEIQTYDHGDYRDKPWLRPGDTELVAKFEMPGGRMLATTARFDHYHLNNPDYTGHVVRKLVDDLTRAVGRQMLGVE